MNTHTHTARVPEQSIPRAATPRGIIFVLRILYYHRMFCEHQTFANFAMVDQFATIKSAKPKLLLVNTHDLARTQ